MLTWAVKMKVPSRHNIAHDFCESIYRTGAKNTESAINYLRGNFFRVQQAKETLSRLVSDGVLQKNNDSYSLTDEMRRYIHASFAFAGNCAIVQPAEPTEFKPLSSKYFLNNAVRSQFGRDLREVSFMSSGRASSFRHGEK
jgi:hypothetical protein